MNIRNAMMVIIPEEEWSQMKQAKREILNTLRALSNKREEPVKTKYITTIEFMAAVGIRRTKLDQLVSANEIRIVRKGRKIYVPSSEVDRYFAEPSIA